VLRRCGYTVLEACWGEEGHAGNGWPAGGGPDNRASTRHSILLMSGYSFFEPEYRLRRPHSVQKPSTATELALKVRKVLSAPASS
jgi:hypothetical protein